MSITPRLISPEGDRVWNRVMVHLAEDLTQGVLGTSDYYDAIKLRLALTYPQKKKAPLGRKIQ